MKVLKTKTAGLCDGRMHSTGSFCRSGCSVSRRRLLTVVFVVIFSLNILLRSANAEFSWAFGTLRQSPCMIAHGSHHGSHNARITNSTEG